MGMMIQKKKQAENIRNYIDKILKNQEIDCDEEWWNGEGVEEELTKLAGTEKNHVCDPGMFSMEGDERLVFAAFRERPEELLEELTKLACQLAEQSELAGIQFIFFVRDMKGRVCLEEALDRDFLTKLRANVRRVSGNRRLSVHCTYILQKEFAKQDVKLKNLMRHEMIQMPPIRGRINQEGREETTGSGSPGEHLNALVFTMDLYQLAELYNLIGDKLFKNNVRFGISEMLGVDYSIRETLDKEPELFWFKNNGIVVLVENPDFRPKNAEELVLDHIGRDKEPGFSVVNGAQTITTSARYFFEMEYRWQNSSEGSEERLRYQKKLEAAKKAQVLVRIIHISGEKEQSSDMAKALSVALNRQKPIKMEDIAFTLRFVEKLTGYLNRPYADNKESFGLVRRGEGGEAGQYMDLVEFARARKACLGEPGEARSQGAKTLLKIQPGEGLPDFFQQKDIFVDEWLEADEAEEERVFRRHYGALWFAHQAAREYDRCRKAVAKEQRDDFRTVINNGKWYFTAVLVRLLNGFAPDFVENGRGLPDFTRFTVPFGTVRENIPGAMGLFADIVLLYIEGKEEYKNLDSNLFKKSDLYKNLMEEIRHFCCLGAQGRTKLECRIQELADLFLGEGDRACYAGDGHGMGEPPAAGQLTNKVVLKGSMRPLESIVQAMKETVRYVLENYPLSGEQIKEHGSGWLTDEENVEGAAGCMRRPERIQARGKNYWVGTLSNTRVKCRQMARLCQAAGVPKGKGEVAWYGDSPDEPVFYW
ncbi:hypothetical protein D3Z51_13205 [Clostridiaceae bacterium]|nr:hypothetical protein [Clostridiaceae bacterium]RKI11197.1 hypothetical protein D7V81_14180 [bacterium 1XD21-70]